MKAKTKVDMRFNAVRESIQEISKSMQVCPLNNEAVAILVANATKGVTKTQVKAVLTELQKLEKTYLKPEVTA